MKIDVKHLAPYLPYGLKSAEGFKAELKNLSAQTVETFSNIGSSNYFTRIAIEGFVPELRSMSQLNEVICHNGKTFLPIRELFKMAMDADDEFDPIQIANKFDIDVSMLAYYLDIDKTSGFQFNYNVDQKNFVLMTMPGKNGEYLCQYDLMQKLFEWHFDVFGLIHKGLAVELTNDVTNNIVKFLEAANSNLSMADAVGKITNEMNSFGISSEYSKKIISAFKSGSLAGKELRKQLEIIKLQSIK